ncbi:putative ABC transporter (ATP-binding protein) [Bacillus sp. 349Y]|nr:putative ABC transporter (ATP-binding protein) [Bacillus sp. 349Y]
MNKASAQPNVMRRGPRGIGGPVAKAEDQKGVVKRIWRYLRADRTAIVLSSVFVVLSTLFSLGGPYLIGVIIDDHIIPKDVPGTIRYLIVLAAVYLGAALFTWLQTFMMVRVSLRTIMKLRQDIVDKWQTLSLRFFDKRTHGDNMSRVTNDIDTLNNALSQGVIQIVSSVLMVGGVTIAMVSLNWVLALVALCVIPFMVWATKRLVSYSRSYFTKRQRDLGRVNGYVEESISGNEVITLFSQEDKVDREFSELNEQLRQSARAADTVSGFVGPINNFINSLGLGLIIAVGAVMAVRGMTTVGVIAAFVTYSRQFFRPINQLSSLLNVLQSAIAGAERVFEVLDEEPDVVNRSEAIMPQSFKGDVVFSHVDFRYEDEAIMKNVSFHVHPGEKVALVGPTGSGKTTIINLLMRLYDVTGGSIEVDGKDIRDYEVESLRRRFGVVLQDTYLFSGSIMDNIRYGRLEATDEEVIQAARMASAHPFISRLSGGYGTKLSSGGTNLSQGERQLLAIARAILADSELLILDEATSSIDTKTEAVIQEGINRLTEGRTSFIIAHRLKTIENADRILVIHQGEILETGTHEELLSKKGFYADMYESQFTL